MTIDYHGKTLLVVGASRGIGLAIAQGFARAGAHVWLTHRWNSLNDEQLATLLDKFPADNRPVVVEASADDPADTRRLYELMHAQQAQPHGIIVSAAMGKPIDDLSQLTRKGLATTLAHTTWPILDYALACRETFGDYPRHVIALTSDGSRAYIPRYAMIGMAKAALETLVLYMAVMLEPHRVQVNAINAGFVDTIGTRAVFGDAFTEQARQAPPPDVAQGIANLTLAMCSGLMDEVNGQTINATRAIGLNSALSLLHAGPVLYQKKQGNES